MHKKVFYLTDLHFKNSNVEISDVIVDQSIKLLNEKINVHGKENIICVLGGDLLDTHEKLHQIPYNKIINFINSLRQLCETFILVGNHDMINNKEFLTDNHWMNPLKYWENTVVVDKPVVKYGYTFVPYVYPGRFLEALSTIEPETLWKESLCIFAHQEFKGCDVSFIKSEIGDEWNECYPLVISGHIHKTHWVKNNIFYPGSIVQQNFGEEFNKETGVYFFDFDEEEFDKKFVVLPIEVPRVKTITVNVENFEDTLKNLKVSDIDRIRINVLGSPEDFKTIQNKNLLNNLPIGVKVKFTQKECELGNICREELGDVVQSFYETLSKNVSLNGNEDIIFNIISNLDKCKEFSEVLDLLNFEDK